MNNQNKQSLDNYLTHDYRQDFPPACKECATELDWEECWDCVGEGVTHHECGDDTCACLIPEDNVICQTCSGENGWYRCPICKKVTMENEVTVPASSQL